MKSIINKNYSKLFFATLITRFGDSLDSIAFSWLVYVMTGSRVLMGSIFAISILPNIIILPFGGVIADVFNKKKITALGDVLRGISVALLAVLFVLGWLQVWHLFVFVTMNSIFESFANPARRAMLPSIIEPQDYIKGSSWLGSASNIGSLVGLSIASVVIAIAGIWSAILIDAITFFVSAILIYFIHFVDNKKEDTQRRTTKDYFVMIGEGFTYLKSKKILFILLLLAAFVNFAFVPFNVLSPVYVSEVLNMGVEGLSYIGVSNLLGMTLGGYLMGAKGKNVNPITAIGFGLCSLGLLYVLLGVPEFTQLSSMIEIGYAMIVLFLFGCMLPVINAPIQTIIMKTTAPEMMGRLSSIIGMIALCAMPLGGVFVSLIGDSLSISALFAVMGVSSVILSSTFWVKNRKAVIA